MAEFACRLGAPDGSVIDVRPANPCPDMYLGYDAGCRLLNFNDDFQGTAPDMGAVESGQPFPVPPTWPAF